MAKVNVFVHNLRKIWSEKEFQMLSLSLSCKNCDDQDSWPYCNIRGHELERMSRIYNVPITLLGNLCTTATFRLWFHWTYVADEGLSNFFS